ncbi:MAG TPA: MBL fold metallo-hydrolase, partial [Pyrinomonadaceae bacterium]|nr:MBL fold metallo-hydrolase [Pyrinomonadaceae bacterium]
SLALRLEDEEGVRLVYTSDTGYGDALADFARGAELLVIECSFPRDKRSAKHLELTEAMKIAREAAPRRVLLTHLYPEWDGLNLNAEARKLWPGETIEARDGLRLNIK